MIGKSAVAGTDAAICTSGCATAASFGLSPINTPTGTVHKPASASVNNTLKNVAPAPQPMLLTSARVRCESSAIIRVNAYSNAHTATNPQNRAIHGPLLLGSGSPTIADRF